MACFDDIMLLNGISCSANIRKHLKRCSCTLLHTHLLYINVYFSLSLFSCVLAFFVKLKVGSSKTRLKLLTSSQAVSTQPRAILRLLLARNQMLVMFCRLQSSHGYIHLLPSCYSSVSGCSHSAQCSPSPADIFV